MSSLIIENGEYAYRKNSKRLATSDNKVFQAMIELALEKGKWGYFPGAGHELRKYLRGKQTDQEIESLQKELKLYLQKYSPEVRETLRSRFKEVFRIEV